MIVRPSHIWKGEMNCNNYLPCPMNSSATRNDGGDESRQNPFLRSIQTNSQLKGPFGNKDLSADLFEIAPLHRKNMIANDNERNPMRHSKNGPCALSLCLDKMALDGGSNHSIDSRGGVLPVGKDPDVFVQNSNYQQQRFILETQSDIPKGLVSKNEEKELFPKGNKDVQTKREEISFYTLNKLMERTASSRCFLLQQTKESSNSSAPLMRSLSASAFKTIVSSTKITSSTSAKSFRTATKAPAAFTTSDFVNSSFDNNTDYSQRKPKKLRRISGLDPVLSGAKKGSSRRSEKMKGISITGVKHNVRPMIRSLPSCGSLESAERESLLDEANQKSASSLPVEICAPINETPFGEKSMIHSRSFLTNGFTNTMIPSHSSETISSSVESDLSFQELIQSLSSSSKVRTSGSLQTKRKFNSFQVPIDNNNVSSRLPARGFSGGDLQDVFRRQERKGRNKPSGKISQTMKLKLRQELQRTTSKPGSQESPDRNWLL
uniref:Uncharacterized protein n=1 Tax=Pseudo-nitzschia arenysensis TaxID=697910 RepID=A0A7R9ZU63_9STRA|mmetsp:Transcript_783/g.1852  ORF Transcript_783/g.1852 Transcript_783/m.1852 type:complete len:492 (+) Transcript_783:59-1534(+)